MDKYDSIIVLNGDDSMVMFQVILVLYEAHKDDLQALEDILAFTGRLANDGFTYDATGYIYETVRLLRKEPWSKDPEHFRKEVYGQLTEYLVDQDIYSIDDDDQDDFALYER
jgi:hypothetical protein